VIYLNLLGAEKIILGVQKPDDHTR